MYSLARPCTEAWRAVVRTAANLAAVRVVSWEPGSVAGAVAVVEAVEVVVAA